MSSPPVMRNIDFVLNNPGIFAFQIQEDRTTKMGKNRFRYDNGAINTIQQNIAFTFNSIIEQLEHFRHQSPNYLSQIITKLQRFVHNRRFLFPGLQVINITRSLLNFFSHFPHRFLICEKSDGVRYLMLHFHNGINLFIGRNLEFFQVKLTEKLGQSDNFNDWRIVHFLDGELVIDDVDDGDKGMRGNEVIIDGQLKRVKFLVFDAIVINDENVGGYPFKTRIEKLSELFKSLEFARYSKNTSRYFIKKYSSDINLSDFISDIKLTNDINMVFSSGNEGSIVYSSSAPQQVNPFSIELYMKDYFTLDKVRNLYSIVHNLPHHNDGIIINTDDYPYYSGQSTEIFKWKPSIMNTIDFELKYNDKIKGFEMYVKDKTENIPVSILFVHPDDQKAFQEGYSQVGVNVAECYFDIEYNSDDVVRYHYIADKIGREGDSIINIIKNYESDFHVSDSMKNSYGKGGWRFMRYRKDKGTANSIFTYRNILVSLTENIVIEDIIEEVARNMTIPIKDLEEAKNCISAAVWEKFYNFREGDDYGEPVSNGDMLMNSVQTILSNKRTREEPKPPNKKVVQFNIASGNNNSSRSEPKPTNIGEKEKKQEPVKNRKEIIAERREQKKKERFANFSQSLDLLNNTSSSTTINQPKPPPIVENPIEAVEINEPFSHNEQSVSLESSESSDSDI